MEAIESTVASGRPAYLFDSLYLPVDSIINDEAVGRFDVEPARQYLALGWEICGVVPRTTGVGLKNSTGVVTNAWGGGLGGNVVGVHLLLRYRIDSETLETSRHTMTDHFERTIPLSN